MLRLFTLLELTDYGYSSKYFKMFLFREAVELANHESDIDDIKLDFNSHILSNWDRESIKSLIQDYDGNTLVYLNEYLFAKENNNLLNLGAKYDIEHIMPNSGSNIQVIRKDAGIDTEEEFLSIVNKIGNKIILEEKINRSIGNEWFRTKVSTKLEKKTGYIDSKYPIANALVEKYSSSDKPYWTKDDIKNATEKASERIVQFIFDET